MSSKGLDGSLYSFWMFLISRKKQNIKHVFIHIYFKKNHITANGYRAIRAIFTCNEK